MDILQTRNPTWGFYGTFGRHATDPSAAWPLAMEAIAKATGCTPKDIRCFLDSKCGRHFGDDVVGIMSANIALETAINDRVAQLMCWTISPKDESDYGIPAGLPYLTGMVTHCEKEADTGEGRAHRAQPFV